MKPTARQALFVNGVLSGKSAAESARQAGYGSAYSKKAATTLLTQKPVAALIEQGQAELREVCMYDAQSLVEECDALILFGREKGNPMSCVKALELKAKALGLLIEKIQVTDVIDISSALLEAKQRVYGPVQISSSSVSLPESHRAHDPVNGDIFS